MQRKRSQRTLGRFALEVSADAAGERVTFATLLFGTLTARHRIAQPFFGNGDFAAKLLRSFALVGYQSRELGASGLRAGTFSQVCLAGCFSCPQRFLRSGKLG